MSTMNSIIIAIAIVLIIIFIAWFDQLSQKTKRTEVESFIFEHISSQALIKFESATSYYEMVWQSFNPVTRAIVIKSLKIVSKQDKSQTTWDLLRINGIQPIRDGYNIGINNLQIVSRGGKIQLITQ